MNSMETQKPENDQEPTDEVITLSEAGKILHASYATVLRLATSGELKAFRIRNSWRTSKFACNEYIRTQFKKQAFVCRSIEIK